MTLSDGLEPFALVKLRPRSGLFNHSCIAVVSVTVSDAQRLDDAGGLAGSGTLVAHCSGCAASEMGSSDRFGNHGFEGEELEEYQIEAVIALAAMMTVIAIRIGEIL